MRRHSLEKILECTLHYCNITRAEWEDLSHRRLGCIVFAKQLVSHIAFNEGYECKEIARFFGNHRTTTIHHIKTLRDEIIIYPHIQKLVDSIIDKLGPLPQEPQKQMVTYGWLARSTTGLLTLSQHVPEKLGGYWIAEGSKPFPSDQFPQITYETGPVKVEIKVTLEENEKM